MNKPIEDFKIRFNKALSIRNIKPTDLAEKSGLSKSTISHYMSGYTKPKSDKLFILAKVLSVDEAWLMGHDVPMDKKSGENKDADLTGMNITTQVMFVLRKLLDEGKVTIENAETGKRTTFLAEDVIGELSNGNSELLLLEFYRLLNELGQSEAIKQLALLAKIPEYQKTDNSAPHISTNIDSSPIIEFHSHMDKSTFFVPYFRGSVSAGNGIFILGNEATDELEIPDVPEYENADYAISVNGKSMEPTYSDGDIVLVSQGNKLKIGDIGIFVVNGEAFIKELGEDKLISHNKNYPNITIRDCDNIVCMGKVIAKL